MALTPERILLLKDAATALASAGHGEKGRIAAGQAAALGCDTKTLYRLLAEAGFGAMRKRRSDAGKLAVSKDEVMTAMSMKVAAQRANGKDIMGVNVMADLARNNGLAALGRLDKESGELVPVSDATLRRAIRSYQVDLKTLRTPAPHRGAKSLHPNHVWQIDASVCVLFYLDNGGLGVIEHDEFYKNKPENIEKKFKSMVIRYVVTDHYSGAVYFRYYLGAESGENLCSVLINAMQERGSADLLHGVPRILMLDAGSANTAAMTRNLCRSLGIELEVHKVGNARATGQVENSRNIIERKFEALLCHASQHVDPAGMQVRVREWMAATATANGLPAGRYAEGYRVVRAG